MERENMCLRRSCESMSILVVDDDTTCLSFVAALLKKFKYEVVTAKHPNDALCALRIKNGAFDLVVSDVHMPDMNGFQLQQTITHEFSLPVILMSVDSKEGVVAKGLESGAALFISKPVSPNDLKDLWQFVAMRKKNQDVIEDMNNKENSKRKSAASKEKEGSESDVNNTKKPKVIWTNALHYRFLEAIRSIGLERSVPKKILQVMNVPGLTRENVASHLQKYRMFLKRVSDASYKIAGGGDDDRRTSISNYSSLLTLNRLNNYQTCIDPSFHTPQFQNLEIISDSMHQKSGSSCSMNFHSYNNKFRNNIIEQYLGDSCYVDSGDCQHDQLQLPPPPPSSNPSLLLDSDSALCYVYDQLPAFDINTTQQSLNPTHHHLHNISPSHKLNMIQNQPQRHGCNYSESSLLYDGITNSSHDQSLYQQVQGSMNSVEFGSGSSQFNKALESPNECDEDDALESLLAFGPFGEDQIQTLEGI